MIEFAQPSEEFRRLNPHIFSAEQHRIDPTPQPCSAHTGVGLEKQLQAHIYADLSRRDLYFHWSRTDKKTTTRVGTPDFALPLKGKYVAIECKIANGQQTKEQCQVQHEIEAQGGVYHLIRSFDDYLKIIVDSK